MFCKQVCLTFALKGQICDILPLPRILFFLSFIGFLNQLLLFEYYMRTHTLSGQNN